MATPTKVRRRRALGLRDINIFTPRRPLRQYSSGGSPEVLQEEYEGLPSKRPLKFTDDGQTPGAWNYFDVSEKRVGIDHWLKDGIANDVQEDRRLAYISQESLLSFEEAHFQRAGEGRLGASTFTHYEVEPSQAPENLVPSTLSSFPTSAAAFTLRLRLRVALFKVQTNQTAIPISHLQLPEISPQPLSVFPPSLVRINADNNAHDEYYNGYDEPDSLVSAPASSPPPLVDTDGGYNNRGVPFLTPIRSSSPSPNHGKPLDFGSSSDLQESISRDCSPAPI